MQSTRNSANIFATFICDDLVFFQSELQFNTYRVHNTGKCFILRCSMIFCLIMFNIDAILDGGSITTQCNCTKNIIRDEGSTAPLVKVHLNHGKGLEKVKRFVEVFCLRNRRSDAVRRYRTGRRVKK